MNYFEKKQWIRLIICAVVLLAVSLVLSGVIGGEHLVYPKPAELTGAVQKDVTVKGFQDGEVQIQIGAAEDGTVESLIIDASTQTEGLGAKASEEAFTSQFIGKKGPFVYGENGIEAITGATITSNAVIAGINEALGTEPASAEPAEEPKAEEPTEADLAAAAAKDVSFNPGTYEAEAQGLLSPVKVRVTVSDTEITGSPDAERGYRQRRDGDQQCDHQGDDGSPGGSRRGYRGT